MNPDTRQVSDMVRGYGSGQDKVKSLKLSLRLLTIERRSIGVSSLTNIAQGLGSSRATRVRLLVGYKFGEPGVPRYSRRHQPIFCQTLTFYHQRPCFRFPRLSAILVNK